MVNKITFDFLLIDAQYDIIRYFDKMSFYLYKIFFNLFLFFDMIFLVICFITKDLYRFC